MDTLDKLVALIREFAEKASVPAAEAAQAVIRIVQWECVGQLVAGFIFFVVVAIGFIVALRMLTQESRKPDREQREGITIVSAVVSLVLGTSLIVGGGLALVDALPRKFACIAEPLGYTLKRMVLK